MLTCTLVARACLEALDSASPRTASRCGAVSSPTRVRTGPSSCNVGRNLSVAAARSTSRVSSVCRSAASSEAPRAKIDRRMSLMVASRSSTAVLDALPGHRVVRQPRLTRLQPQADREQALDHQVVQVAADPVAVLEESQALLGLARTLDQRAPGQPAPRSWPGSRGSTSWKRSACSGVQASASAPTTTSWRAQRDQDRRPDLGPARDVGHRCGAAVRLHVLERDRLPRPEDLPGQRGIEGETGHVRRGDTDGPDTARTASSSVGLHDDPGHVGGGHLPGAVGDQLERVLVRGPNGTAGR